MALVLHKRFRVHLHHKRLRATVRAVKRSALDGVANGQQTAKAQRASEPPKIISMLKFKKGNRCTRWQTPFFADSLQVSSALDQDICTLTRSLYPPAPDNRSRVADNDILCSGDPVMNDICHNIGDR